MAQKTSEELAQWHRELEIARHNQRKHLANWQYWEKVYNDQLWGGQELSSSQRRSSVSGKGYMPQLNELESLVLSILPDILFFSPVFEFTPIHSEWDWSAGVWELFASFIYDTKKIEDTLEEITVDTLNLGSGIHKSGYEYEIGNPSYQLGDATAGDPEISEAMVFSDWISPMDLLIDYRVKRWSDLRWIAHEFRVPVEEVKANKIYRNTNDLKGTENSIGDIVNSRLSGKEFGKKKNDSVKLIEIHDMENSKIITIADKHTKILRKDDDYGIPLFDLLSFTPSRPKSPWGKSIAQSIEEHMIAIAKYLYYMDEHTKRGGVSRWVFDKNRVDRDVIEKMKSSGDFAMIGVDNLSGGSPIEEIKAAGISVDWFNLTNIRESMIRMLSGVSMQERGKHEPGVETAYEASKLAQASSKRNQHRIKKLDKFIASVIEKQLRIISDTWTSEQVLNAIGIPTEFAYRLLPFDKIKINVKHGSTALQARDEELRKVTTLAGILGQAGIQVNPEGFVKLVANALGLSYQQIQLLLQQAPQAGQAAGGQGQGNGEPGGGSANQILSQLKLAGG
jgi:hypothetical protein